MLNALILALALCGAEERGLPLIVESVDQIIVVHTEGSDHSRVVFIRGDAVLATRLMVDDMRWATDGEHIILEWQDYWTAERVIQTPVLSTVTVPANPDPAQEGQDGLWWCMFRNMRDLKQP